MTTPVPESILIPVGNGEMLKRHGPVPSRCVNADEVTVWPLVLVTFDPA